MTRILVADDHPLMLAGILGLLADTGFEVIAVLAEGSAALDAILSLEPDIALIDNSMPGLTGVEIIREARKSGSITKIVLLTAHLHDDDLVEVIKLGVDGIVLKDDGGRELVECLEAIASGSRWIPRETMNRVTQIEHEKSNDPLNLLTPRELEIAQLAAQGLRNRGIGEACGLTEGSVKVYLNRVYEKLGVSTRTELSVMINRVAVER